MLVQGKKKDETIVISTPPSIIIQDLYDAWFKNGTKDKAFLFSSLRAPKDEYVNAKKILRRWNVKIDSVHSNKRTNASRDAIAIDQGGPTD